MYRKVLVLILILILMGTIALTTMVGYNDTNEPEDILIMKRTISFLLVFLFLMSGSVVAVDLHNDDLQSTNLKEHMQWSDENSEVIEYYGVNKDGNEPKSIQEWLYTG